MADNLRKVDLNLLLIFDALWMERSVSAAASRLGLTQSAVSLALGRLRVLFNDHLMVWNGKVMHPTGKCEELAPRIHLIIASIRDTMQPGLYSPQHVAREFSIATADYINWAIGGRLLKRVCDEAPRFTIYMVDVKPTMAIGHAALQNEFIIVPKGAISAPGMRCSLLFRDRYVLIAAKDNPSIEVGMSVEQYLTLSHVAYTTDAKILFSHEAHHLGDDGIIYKNNMLTPHYMTIPFIVAQTNCVAIVQERLARYFKEILPIEIFLPPISYPFLDISLYWHPNFDADPSHKWLREVIIDECRALPALPDYPRAIKGRISAIN